MDNLAAVFPIDSQNTNECVRSIEGPKLLPQGFTYMFTASYDDTMNVAQR